MKGRLGLQGQPGMKGQPEPQEQSGVKGQPEPQEQLRMKVQPGLQDLQTGKGLLRQRPGNLPESLMEAGAPRKRKFLPVWKLEELRSSG